jgi:ubiquinone biosynthesis protein UbiJ
MNVHGRFFIFSMIPSPFLAVINHLLAQEPWARAKLVAHAGKVVCMDFGLMPVFVKVAPDGTLQAATDAQPTNVRIGIKLADLPLIVQNRERAFSYVTVEGDADFANAISQLSQSLRWEAEEDLSRWVGDIAAARIITGAKAALDGAKLTQQKLAENLAEYLLEENPMLARAQAVADFCGDVTKLRDDSERLAKRIEKLR